MAKNLVFATPLLTFLPGEEKQTEICCCRFYPARHFFVLWHRSPARMTKFQNIQWKPMKNICFFWKSKLWPKMTRNRMQNQRQMSLIKKESKSALSNLHIKPTHFNECIDFVLFPLKSQNEEISIKINEKRSRIQPDQQHAILLLHIIPIHLHVSCHV